MTISRIGKNKVIRIERIYSFPLPWREGQGEGEVEQSPPPYPSPQGGGEYKNGFTLVELLIAAAVTAVGMVFILGAFSQCVSSQKTAANIITANYLLNRRLWESGVENNLNNGSVEGQRQGGFEAPNQAFGWQQSVEGITQDFGNATQFIQEDLNEETLKIIWQQGKAVKDISVTRYVHRKKE